MGTWHKIVFADCRKMNEIPAESVHLMVTSPPYYNAPFDYPDLFKDYGEYKNLLRGLAKELKRVIAPGRIMAFVTDDTLIDGEKYPVVADITKIMMEAGFRYRDKIIWKKPEGYIRISHRSGALLQHPYPMYFYPDNLQESILLFQKGEFDYAYIKHLPAEVKEASKVDLVKFSNEKWNLTIWEIVNVLPVPGRLEEGIAAFPEEIPKRLIALFSFVGETLLDPFLGSGTTTKVSREMQRNSYGYEIDLELKPIITKKIGYRQSTLLDEDHIDIIVRQDSKRLRTFLQQKVKKPKSVTRNLGS